MERLKQRLITSKNALKTLIEILEIVDPSIIERDASI